MEEDSLKADEFEKGEEHADDGALGVGVAEQFPEGDGAVFQEQAALGVVDHLGDSDGVFIDVEDGAGAEAGEDVLKDADEVDGVGGDLAVGTDGEIGEVGVCVGGVQIFEEGGQAGEGPGGLLDLLALEEHLGGGFEALVFEEALDEFAAGIFAVGAVEEVGGIAGEEGFAFDVDEERGHVDEVAGGIDVDLLEVMGVLEELGGDAGDRDVVDVDVLFADQVEKQVHGSVVDAADCDREGGLGGFGGSGFGGGVAFRLGGRGRGLEGEGGLGGLLRGPRPGGSHMRGYLRFGFGRNEVFWRGVFVAHVY